MTHEGTIGESPERGSAHDEWSTLLQGHIDAAYSARNVDQVARDSAQWILTAPGVDALNVRILVRSGLDRLRPIAVAGERILQGRRRSARRRDVLLTGTPRAITLRRPTGLTLAILPLREDAHTFGVTEVLLRGPITDRRWDVLKGMATLTAVSIWTARAREQLERQVETLSRAARLAGDLLEAGTGPAAVLAASRFIAERFEVPVAAWWARGDPGWLSLLAVRGFGSRRRARLRSTMRALTRWGFLSEEDRRAVLDRFRTVVDPGRTGTGVSALDAGPALLLMAGDGPALRSTLDVVRPLLVEALSNLERVGFADRRNEQLDLGLAWTAHEVRGPLNGVRAVLDLFLTTAGPDQPMRDLLERSRGELDELAGKVEGVLRWSTGQAPLRRSQVDLVGVVRGAVESCVLETGQSRVDVSAPDGVEIVGDPDQLKSAIANLVRNAIAYSPADSAVLVRVNESRDRVLVSVRDRGAGVLAKEQEAIFDPFVRSRSGVGRGAGAGLGLFIARRVVEAHSGYLWMESTPFGTTFHIGLPRADPEARLREEAGTGERSG